jgi:hypothetical protein
MPTTNIEYSGQFSPGTFIPTFDPTGSLVANLITGEKHTVTAENGKDFHVIIPVFAPLLAKDLQITFKPLNGTNVILLEGIDYNLCYQFIGATRGCAMTVYGGIYLINNKLSGIVTIRYRTLGGNWTLNSNKINELLANQIQNPRTTSWEQIVQLPNNFPVIDHEWNLTDLVGASELVSAVDNLANVLSNQTPLINAKGLEAKTLVELHSLDKGNPHDVNKHQIGLGAVENYSTATDLEAVNSSLTNKLMTPRSTSLVIDKHKQDLDPHTQYVLKTDLSLIEGSINTKINNHTTSTDPHGDRAYSDSVVRDLKLRILGTETINFLDVFLVAQGLSAINYDSDIQGTLFLDTFNAALT